MTKMCYAMGNSGCRKPMTDAMEIKKKSQDD